VETVSDSGDPHLLRRVHALASNHLEVIPGDIGEPNLGLDEAA
jgi:fatty acid CoA ligase FadD9